MKDAPALSASIAPDECPGLSRLGYTGMGKQLDAYLRGSKLSHGKKRARLAIDHAFRNNNQKSKP